MKVLLVEDDEDKREQLLTFLTEKINSEINDVRSFQSGLRMIKNNLYDLILLDMTMPTFDTSSAESGGRSQPFGGEMLLHEMLRRNISTKSIVVTQFDIFGTGDDEITLPDLDFKLKETFPNYCGVVQYHISYTFWKDDLLSKIKKAGFII